MRTRAVVLVLIVVVLGGCAAYGGSIGGANDGTKTTTPQELTDFPNGLNNSGVTDAKALIGTYKRALNNKSYTSTYTTERGNVTATIQTKFNPNTEELLISMERRETEDGLRIYQTGSRRYEMRTNSGNTTYLIKNAPFETPGITGPGWKIRYLLRHAQYDNPTMENTESGVVISYGITGFREEGVADGSLVVSESGIIKNFSISVELENRTTTYRVKTDDVRSTSIERPEWIEVAKNGTEEGSNGQKASYRLIQ